MQMTGGSAAERGSGPQVSRQHTVPCSPVFRGPSSARGCKTQGRPGHISFAVHTVPALTGWARRDRESKSPRPPHNGYRSIANLQQKHGFCPKQHAKVGVPMNHVVQIFQSMRKHCNVYAETLFFCPWFTVLVH